MMMKRLFLDTSVVLDARVDALVHLVEQGACVPQLVVVELLLELRTQGEVEQRARRALGKLVDVEMPVAADPFDEVRVAFGGEYRDWPACARVSRRLAGWAWRGMRWSHLRTKWNEHVRPGGTFLAPDAFAAVKDQRGEPWFEMLEGVLGKEREIRFGIDDFVIDFCRKRGLGEPTKGDYRNARKLVSDGLRRSAWPRIWYMHKLAQTHDEPKVLRFPMNLLEDDDTWVVFRRVGAYYGYVGGLDLAFDAFTDYVEDLLTGKDPHRNDFFDHMMLLSVPDDSDAAWVTQDRAWLGASDRIVDLETALAGR